MDHNSHQHHHTSSRTASGAGTEAGAGPHEGHGAHEGEHGAHSSHSGEHTGHENHTAHEHHGTHTGHENHAGHEHHGHGAHGGGAPVSWRMAASATLHCLTGCAIGEVLGMVIGTALGWSNWPTVGLAVALAFVFGYSLTMLPVLRAGLPLRTAIGVALAADTVSIIVMEIIDNAAMMVIPGAMEAGLASPVFWGSLAGALAIAFVVTVPVNRWLIGKGKGHAVVHQYHAH
ncbi:DUF4396 domain-containing protein [Longispora albida]|uniref:DUF4396 domain-containing protein n=1 Tax=Longispora albida TaxID=203523 RepID=UPI00036B06D1|nr:DUF4396 domain-containing protein [Longispora albida]